MVEEVRGHILMARKMDPDRSDYDFKFTRNWFRNRNLSTFRDYIYPHWSGRNIVYLEIGVFEGMSLVWMMQHILTSEGSRSVGIDPWLITSKISAERMREVMDRAHHNLLPWRRTGALNTNQKRCTLIQANSGEALIRMNRKGYAGIKKGTVDLCMIDGNHKSGATLDDARLCWPLLKTGGWLLFDDVENDKEKIHHVKEGLDMFLDEIGNEAKFLWEHKYMEAFEKKL